MCRSRPFLLGLVVLVLARPAEAQPRAAESLTVRIVPHSLRDRGTRAITLWQPVQRFHVVVTNTSSQPVRLWQDWCSWGHACLSFTVTGDSGRKTTVKKKPRAWTKNFPDWTRLDPGDHLVLEVSFDEATWQDPPLPTAGHSRVVTMQAVFEVPVDAETQAHGVWTGKVVSPELSYTIFR